jgi:hypothetical protein
MVPTLYGAGFNHFALKIAPTITRNSENKLDGNHGAARNFSDLLDTRIEDQVTKADFVLLLLNM